MFWRSKTTKFLSDPTEMARLPMLINGQEDIQYLLKMFSESDSGFKKQMKGIRTLLLPDERLYFIKIAGVEAGEADHENMTALDVGILFVSDKRIVFEASESGPNGSYTVEINLQEIESVVTHTSDRGIDSITVSTADFGLNFGIKSGYEGLFAKTMRNLLVTAITKLRSSVKQFTTDEMQLLKFVTCPNCKMVIVTSDDDYDEDDEDNYENEEPIRYCC